MDNTPRIIARLDVNRTHQTIKGFGQSGCWWASSWSLSYTEEALDRALAYMYSPTEGIGLTHYRYNVGGGTTLETLPAGRHTQCIEVSPGVYDLSVDALNIGVMEKVLALGAQHVTLFMNSPPARMTITGDTNGNPTGETNHRPDCYEAYARYVADITKLFVDAGYPITYVSPINEPQWAWDKLVQEGCHYTVDQVMTIDRLVIEELERTCPSVRISAPETAAWYNEEYTLEFIRLMAADPVFRNHIDHYGGHSYCSKPENRKKVVDTIAATGWDLPVHQTEWAEMCGGDELGMESALILSDVLHQDLSILSCPLWEFWVGVQGDSDWRGGLVYLRSDGRIETSKRMWALGNYSRFLPGTTRVDLTLEGADPTAVYGTAYVRPDGTRLAVLTNASEQTQVIDFAGLNAARAQVHLTDAAHDLAPVGTWELADGCTLPPQSVVTLIFE